MFLEFVISAALFASTVISECPGGWTSCYGEEKCLRAYQEKMTFADALRYCEDVGAGDRGTLVSIHNAFQNTQIAALIESDSDVDTGWIGLRDLDGNGDYTWTDGSPLDYTNWNGDPPFPDGKARTVYLDTTLRNKWATSSDPLEKMFFVCQRGGQAPETTTTAKVTQPTTVHQGCVDGWFPFGKHCYTMPDMEGTWSTSVRLCPIEDDAALSYEPALVSIHSPDEAQAIASFFGHQQHWIGLSRSGPEASWSWSDGSALDFEYWDPNSVTDGNCVEAGSNVLWIKSDCTNKISHVCKYQR